MKKFLFICTIIAVFSLAACGSSDNSGEPAVPVADSGSISAPIVESDASSDIPEEQEPVDDLSAVAKEYSLTGGNYVVGIDIPAGTCDVLAVSGNGNLSSSNMFAGGINEIFGIDDGSGMYTSSFNNLELPDDATLKLSGDLSITLSYSEVTSNFSGRTYDETAAIDLESGNYTAGTDFPAGTYKLALISGNGNVSSDNMFDGGLNEIFGEDDGSGFYTNQFMNAIFHDGTVLTLGGVSIKLIPAN